MWIDPSIWPSQSAGVTAPPPAGGATERAAAPPGERGAGAGRLAAAEGVGRVHLGMEDRGRKAGRLDRELDEDGEQALAHLGVAVVERDRGVVFNDQAALAPLGGAVADPAVLDPAGDPHRPTRALRLVVGGLDRLQRPGDTHGLVEHLAGAEEIALLDDVAAADLPGVDPHPGREEIQRSLHSAVGLVRAEAPQG